jgi:hypothetical protein
MLRNSVNPAPGHHHTKAVDNLGRTRGAKAQKFPATAPNLENRTWARTIPVPRHIANRLAQFAQQEKAHLVNNFAQIIGIEQPVRACETGSSRFKRVFKYKPVSRKVRPVPGVTPEDTKVTRRFPADPLLNLPTLPTEPPAFAPTDKFTQERMDNLKVDEKNDLTYDERALFKHVLLINERSIAFDDNERGTFRQDYFSDYKIPLMEHEPWSEPNIPVPPGLREEIMQLLREKIEAGVYEPTQSSYRSKWFCVKKKTGGLRIVHDLQQLNSVTIRDAGVPPILDGFVEAFAGRSVYSVLDMYWGFYAWIMDPASRDLTVFQTDLGALRIVSLPMGFTNSPAEFQACMMFILREEICNRKAGVFIDDIPINGPRTQYLDASGEPETLPENPRIRKYIWEHLNDLHRVLWRIGEAGGTVSKKKMQLCKPRVEILGQTCSPEGRHPSQETTSKVNNWPTPINVTEVRGFLGLCGTVRIWIQDFSQIARPMVDLVKKDIEFHWGPKQEEAFQQLKHMVTTAPAIRPIDYQSD